jgi:hypothetical protein
MSTTKPVSEEIALSPKIFVQNTPDESLDSSRHVELKNRSIQPQSQISYSDEFFGERSFVWFSKFGSRSGPISTEKINHNLDYFSNWNPMRKFRKKLVDLSAADSFHFSFERDSDLGKLFVAKKAGKYFFHESRLVDPKYFSQNARKTAFCSIDLHVIDDQKIELRERLFQNLSIGSVNLEKDHFQFYSGVTISFQYPSFGTGISGITCYAYKGRPHEQPYKDLEIHHLYYSLGVLGVIF